FRVESVAGPLLWRVAFLPEPAAAALSTLSLHDALPISHCTAPGRTARRVPPGRGPPGSRHVTPWCGARVSSSRHPTPRARRSSRSEEHTSELQSRGHLGCRLLREKKTDSLDSSLSAAAL